MGAARPFEVSINGIKQKQSAIHHEPNAAPWQDWDGATLRAHFSFTTMTRYIDVLTGPFFLRLLQTCLHPLGMFSLCLLEGVL